MNFIHRDSKSLPELDKTDEQFKREIVGMTRKEAYKHYQEKKHILKYNTEETTQEFKKMNFERCSFCTQIILEFEREMTVEHIETKTSAPEKIFEWENLLCACKACNTKRSTKKYNSQKYLDPTKIEDIERYFAYHADGTISVGVGLTQGENNAAEYMIELYGLNRNSLKCERKGFFKDLIDDDEFYQGLLKQDKNSRRIINQSVFEYYKRRIRNGK